MTAANAKARGKRMRAVRPVLAWGFRNWPVTYPSKSDARDSYHAKVVGWWNVVRVEIHVREVGATRKKGERGRS